MSPEFFWALIVLMGVISAVGVLVFLLPALFGKKGGKDE